jgi:hypothetical protein
MTGGGKWIELRIPENFFYQRFSVTASAGSGADALALRISLASKAGKPIFIPLRHGLPQFTL